MTKPHIKTDGQNKSYPHPLNSSLKVIYDQAPFVFPFLRETHNSCVIDCVFTRESTYYLCHWVNRLTADPWTVQLQLDLMHKMMSSVMWMRGQLSGSEGHWVIIEGAGWYLSMEDVASGKELWMYFRFYLIRKRRKETFKLHLSASEVCCDSTGNTFPIVGEVNLEQFFFLLVLRDSIFSKSNTQKQWEAPGAQKGRVGWERRTPPRPDFVQALNLAGGGGGRWICALTLEFSLWCTSCFTVHSWMSITNKVNRFVPFYRWPIMVTWMSLRTHRASYAIVWIK